MENKNDIINSAIDLIAKGEFSQAAELLEKIQPENENDIETIKNLGLCYINTQEYQKAAQAFKKVLEIDENDATALYYLANCEEKLGFEDEAAQKYQKVLNLRRATISGILGTMEKNGFIERTIDKNDTRIKKITLSPKAKSIYLKGMHYLKSLDEVLIKDISKDDLKTFNKVIEKMHNNLENNINNVFKQ